MKLCLIRHGETIFNLENRLQGILEIDLSPKGRKEAEKLGILLKKERLLPNTVYSSPIKRARETAEIMNLDVPIVIREKLAGRSLGKLEGLTKAEIMIKYPGAMDSLKQWDGLPPGCRETLRDLFKRASDELQILCRIEERSDCVFVVTHSGVIEALSWGWLGIDAGSRLPFKIKNAGAVIMEGSPASGWQFLRAVEAGTNDWTDHA